MLALLVVLCLPSELGIMASPLSIDSPGALVIRLAKPADLDSLTRIAQAGFPDDPEWNYRFPYRREYPDDNWKWTRREYEGYLRQPEKFIVLVATIGTSGSCEPIALAVWDTLVTTAPNAGGMFPLISGFANKSLTR